MLLMIHPRRTIIVFNLGLLAGAAFGQAELTFEVASVKPSAPPGPRTFFGPQRGGPGTRDPRRITWDNARLSDLVMTAWDIQPFQVVAPDWLSQSRFDVVANVPEGVTRRQVGVMWQNLLKERFGMKLHHQPKEFQVDELTVASGGLKMKATDLGPDPDPFNPAENPPPPNGAPQMNGFGSIVRITPDGHAVMTAKALTMEDIATRLARQLQHPVIDKTGLTGRYDFTLDYTLSITPDGAGPARDSATEPGADMASAAERQLGLKLTRAKAMLDVIVIDEAQKVPSPN